jgi:alpha-galactosidase
MKGRFIIAGMIKILCRVALSYSFIVLFVACNGVQNNSFEEKPIIAATPPMGWNSWNAFRKNVNEDIYKEIADALVSTGLADAGYIYVNLDGGWCGENANEPFKDKFPGGITELSNYIHQKGLKFGIYSHWRSFGHEVRDANQWAEWGVDYVKYDAYKTKADSSVWKTMRDAIRSTGRQMVYGIHYQDENDILPDISEVCNMWRFTEDIIPYYNNLSRPESLKWGVTTSEIIDRMADVVHLVKPGCWPDPDMFEIGNLKETQTYDEWATQFTMWCIFPAPLILSNDIRSMSDDVRSILMNKEAIAVNQDTYGLPTTIVSDNGDLEVWARILKNGKVAIVLLNMSEEEHEMEINWKELGSSRKKGFVRDLWSHRDLGYFNSGFKTTVPKHGVSFVTVARLKTRKIQKIS